MTKALDRPTRYKRPSVPEGRPHRVRVQLTDSERAVLQELSRERQIGIPQLLMEAVFRPDKLDPRIVMRELAGVRRILTEEADELRKLAHDRAVSDDLWELVAQGIQWRNEFLTQRYDS